MLLFMDGQAHYDTAGIATKYSAISHNRCVWSVVAEGRFGNCLKRVSTTNANQDLGHLTIAPLTTRLGTWSPRVGLGGVCGFAIKVDDVERSTITGPDPFGLIAIIEGSQHHVTVGLNDTGTFSLRGNASSTSDLLLAQSSEGLTSGAWMFVEFWWLVDQSAGRFKIRVNGITVLDFTGNTRSQDFGHTQLGLWNAVRLLAVQSKVAPYLTVRMCDLYLADFDTADPDDVSDFLGDGIIETILPNGAGASSGWTPSSGANWDMVNDSPVPDGDGTTIATVTSGTKDTYSFQDIPTSAVVKGVHVNLLARKEEEGASSIAPVVRQGTTDYLGPTQGVANITYDRYITQAYDLNPATGAKFTAAEVNAAEFGVQKMV